MRTSDSFFVPSATKCVYSRNRHSTHPFTLGTVDLMQDGVQGQSVNSPARNQEIRNAVLALILADIKSSPRMNQFKRFTKESLKLSGIGKITVPESVWHSLVDAPELAAFAVNFNQEDGTSPEFVIERQG